MNDFSCPIPKNEYDRVVLAHGGGGTLMARLIDSIFRPAFDNPTLNQRHDSAVFNLPATRIAFTTDSYVVRPLFFPGGDIGSMAVHGTVNDLAMSGARPFALSAGYILEEGLEMSVLRRVVESMSEAARRCGVSIVTGDTKVVDKGKGDGVFINTAGLGVIEHGLTIAPGEVRPGDAVIVNGDLGRHGAAILSVREGLEFSTPIESDSAPVHEAVAALFEAGVEVHCLRDLTRGGLVSAMNEIAEDARVTVRLDEDCIPVRDEVMGACELMGFDPLYMANEGRFAAFIAEKDADRALDVLRACEQARGAARVGRVEMSAAAPVVLRGVLGVERVLDRLSGEQLPRIC
ncbi:MAG: hydrogenase expression/formation protein HypE [bacterium]|nr:hydrogenase expression/formation protein HypE [bacterium]